MAATLLHPTFAMQKYVNLLSLMDTQKMIKFVKNTFENLFSQNMNVIRVSAPLFVTEGTGINDDLCGTETKVTFQAKNIRNVTAEVVNSLAKWKRVELHDYNIAPGNGLYTDMNAIRPDEVPDALHSLYVDQWDWERCITASDRTLDYLKSTVRTIYNVLKQVEMAVFEEALIEPVLPNDIHFVHSEELLQMYPTLSPRERENKIAEKYRAVFVIGIGHGLSNGEKHDDRASDYDDWSTMNEDGMLGLNGDIILWNPVLNSSFEISSMGIRVDKNAMEKQLTLCNNVDRTNLLYHKMVLNETLPLSIGGGIGQSRVAMFMLRKLHIGEVQSSVWPEEMIESCSKAGALLL